MVEAGTDTRQELSPEVVEDILLLLALPGHHTREKYEDFIIEKIRGALRGREDDFLKYLEANPALRKKRTLVGDARYMASMLGREEPLTFEFVISVVNFTRKSILEFFPFNKDLPDRIYDSVYTVMGYDPSLTNSRSVLNLDFCRYFLPREESSLTAEDRLRLGRRLSALEQ